jgi:hypothetical protein
MKNIDILTGELKQDQLYWIKFPDGTITIAQWDATWINTCFWMIGSDEPCTPHWVDEELVYNFEVLKEANFS